MTHSFFEKFTNEQIFSLWNSSQTLLEIAQRLGFTGSNLERVDYEHISKRKTREIWKKYIVVNNLLPNEVGSFYLLVAIFDRTPALAQKE
jgi:hypothetical protein